MAEPVWSRRRSGGRFLARTLGAEVSPGTIPKVTEAVLPAADLGSNRRERVNRSSQTPLAPAVQVGILAGSLW